MYMALSDTTIRQARASGTDYTLKDADGLALFVTAQGSFVGAASNGAFRSVSIRRSA